MKSAVFALLQILQPLCLGQYAGYSQTQEHAPIALHQLVIVEPGQDAVVALRGYDLDGDALKATVTYLPTSGMVHQLSNVGLFCVSPARTYTPTRRSSQPQILPPPPSRCSLTMGTSPSKDLSLGPAKKLQGPATEYTTNDPRPMERR